MNRLLFTANEALAFLVELVALAVLGYWGLKAGGVILAIARRTRVCPTSRGVADP